MRNQHHYPFKTKNIWEIPMIEEKYKKLAEMAISLVEGIERTGIRVTHLKKHYGKLLMPLKGNVNHVGMMYAGSLFTIGELSGGILHGVAFDSKNFFPLVKEVWSFALSKNEILAHNLNFVYSNFLKNEKLARKLLTRIIEY